MSQVEHNKGFIAQRVILGVVGGAVIGGVLFYFGHPGWAIGLFSVGVLAGLGGALEHGASHAQCPNCSSKMEFGLEVPPHGVMCYTCHAYANVSNGQVTPVPSNAVASEPAYLTPTPWDDLRAMDLNLSGETFPPIVGRETRPLHATWPQMCCVCGRASTRWMSYDFTVYKRLSEAPRKWAEININVERVPHCDMHADGFRIQRGNFNPAYAKDPPFALTFGFHSYAFRNAFMKLNPWRAY